MSPFISQYGTKPKTSWPGTGWLVGAAAAEAEAPSSPADDAGGADDGPDVDGPPATPRAIPRVIATATSDGTDADDGPSGHGRRVRPQADRVNCAGNPNAAEPAIMTDKEESVSPIRWPAGVRAGGENTPDLARIP